MYRTKQTVKRGKEIGIEVKAEVLSKSSFTVIISKNEVFSERSGNKQEM